MATGWRMTQAIGDMITFNILISIHFHFLTLIDLDFWFLFVFIFILEVLTKEQICTWKEKTSLGVGFSLLY